MDKEGYTEKCQKSFEIDFEKSTKINKKVSCLFKHKENEEQCVTTADMMMWEGELAWPASSIRSWKDSDEDRGKVDNGTENMMAMSGTGIEKRSMNNAGHGQPVLWQETEFSKLFKQHKAAHMPKEKALLSC